LDHEKGADREGKASKKIEPAKALIDLLGT
jgi:hypothetical protein